ncbi:unnamed protein product [Penicillium glandicola]
MLARNLRKARPKSPIRGAQSKRQRRVSPSVVLEGNDQGNVNNPDVQQTQPQSIDSDTTGETHSPNWAVILANVAQQPYPSQIQKYKEWRRAGSNHDDYCCICHGSQRLKQCHTCKLAFHYECLPPGWASNSHDHLFCSICVERGWDKSPPILTPPTSPRPYRSQLHRASSHTATKTNSHPASVPHILGVASSLELQQEGLQAQSVPRENEPSAMDQNTIQDAGHSQPAVRTATDSPEPCQRRPARRKSRYSTLPSAVDTSFAVLYRELESVASLRTQIEELRTQNTQYAQTIKIHEQTQVALRRDLEALRETPAQSESVNKEISELRRRNAALEAELLASKEQAAAAKELKERLAQLLN